MATLFFLIVLPLMLLSGGTTVAQENDTAVVSFDFSEFNLQPSVPKSEFRFGGAYDYISQTYFLLDTLSDRLDSTTKLNEEYLNQPGAFLEATFHPLGNRNLRFNGYAEQSSEYLRGRFESQFQTHSNFQGLSGEVSLETRRRSQGVVEIGDEYTVGRGRLKWRDKFSDRSGWFFALRGEFHELGALDSGSFSSAFTNDYTKVSGEVGLDFELARFDRLALSATLEQRDVPDQLSLSYNVLRFEAEYSGFLSTSFYTIEAALDNRNYNPAGDDSDQLWYRFAGSGQFAIGGDLYFDPEISVEIIDYRLDTSSIYLDQTLSQAEIKLSRRWGLTSFSLGPRIANLSQNQPPFNSAVNATSVTTFSELENFSEEYAEIGLVGEFEYFKIGSLMLTLGNTVGHRDLESEGSYQSDYWFDRISTFTSLELVGNVKLDLVGSVEWEWHSQTSDNSAFYLLNSSISYAL